MNSKLRIKYGMIELEIESDPQTIERERKAFMNTLPSIASMSNHPIIQNEIIEEMTPSEVEKLEYNINKPQTLNAFMTEKGFQTDLDKCLGVIFYINNNENVEYFDSQMIKERMQKSKLVIPKNISLAINKLTGKGFIQQYEAENTTLKQYYITVEGSNYINNFVKKEVKQKNQVKKVKKNRIKEDSKYFGLNKEKLHLDKYPGIEDMKSGKEKVMLIMYIIKKEEQGEYFTVNDIKFVASNIFNERISEDSIKSTFRNKTSAKYFDKRRIENSNKLYEYKMIQTGIKFFEENIIKGN